MKVKFNGSYLLDLIDAKYSRKIRDGVYNRTSSLRKISKGTGIPASSFYHWLDGKAAPGFSSIVKIMRHFDIDDIEEFVEEQ